MRPRYWVVSVVLSAAAITVAYVAATRPGSETPRAVPTQGALGETSSEILGLRAHIAELELALAQAHAASEITEEATPASLEETPPPQDSANEELAVDLGSLLALLEQKNLDALSAELAKLLANGETSFALLTDFLRELMKPPEFQLMRNRGLSFALLAAAFGHPGEASELALHLLSVLDPAKDQALRYQVLGFLSGSLAQGEGRSAELRGRLEEQLLGDLDGITSGNNIWQSLQALNELGVEVPIESLEGILADPSRKNDHTMVLHHLSQRGDDASVELIVEQIHRQQDAKDWSLDQAFQILARMDNPRAQAALEQYVSSPAETVSRAATLAYFTKPRDLGSERLAMGFLESTADLGQKQRLLWQLRSSSPEIFQGVQEQVDSLPSEELQEAVRKVGQTKFPFSLNQSAAGVQPGSAKQAE